MKQFKVGGSGMTTKEFITKWNVGYEDKEQQTEFAREMKADLEAVAETILKDAISKGINYNFNTRVKK